jgi:hypothetical protein
VLDAKDTFVTRATSEAIARRATKDAWRVLAIAAAAADGNHYDWIDSGVRDAVGVWARDRDDAKALCTELTAEPDERLGVGAERLLQETIAAIKPVLYPSE